MILTSSSSSSSGLRKSEIPGAVPQRLLRTHAARAGLVPGVHRTEPLRLATRPRPPAFASVKPLEHGARIKATESNRSPLAAAGVAASDPLHFQRSLAATRHCRGGQAGLGFVCVFQALDGDFEVVAQLRVVLGVLFLCGATMVVGRVCVHITGPNVGKGGHVCVLWHRPGKKGKKWDSEVKQGWATCVWRVAR